MPYDGTNMEVAADLSQIQKHHVCTKGIMKVMGKYCESEIQINSNRSNYGWNHVSSQKEMAGINAIQDGDEGLPVLKEHFDMCWG